MPVLSRLAVCSRALTPLLCIALLALGCDGAEGQGASTGARSTPGADKPVHVEVVRVEPAPLRLEVALTGQLEAEYSVLVRSEITGVIASIDCAEGKPVTEGDVLFRLRDEAQRARLKEAEAAERLARDVFERTQRLTRQDISSIARRAEATAALDEARAKLDLARLDLDRTRLRAPFDGVLGSLMVGPGEWIEPEIALVQIAAIDKLQLLFTIPEPNIRLARVGGEIHARFVAYPNERFPGQVYFISPSIDPASRRLLLKAWVQNAEHRLKPGMFANVDVVVVEKESALSVPEAAMVYDRSGIYVWRVDEENRSQKVPVEIGIRQNGMVEIVSGLAPRDRVVSAGINKVLAGSLIEAVAPHADEGAAVHAEKGSRGPGVASGVEG